MQAAEVQTVVSLGEAVIYRYMKSTTIYGLELYLSLQGRCASVPA